MTHTQTTTLEGVKSFEDKFPELMIFGGATRGDLIDFLTQFAKDVSEATRQDVYDEMKHDQKKFMDSFGYPKHCEMCATQKEMDFTLAE